MKKVFEAVLATPSTLFALASRAPYLPIRILLYLFLVLGVPVLISRFGFRFNDFVGIVGVVIALLWFIEFGLTFIRFLMLYRREDNMTRDGYSLEMK